MSQPCPVEILDILAFHGAAGVADLDLFALAARRGDRREFGDREFALGEDGEDFASDIARRTRDDDPVTHEFVLCCWCLKRQTTGSACWRNRSFWKAVSALVWRRAP